MWIGHRKEIRKLMFRALAHRQSESDKGLTLEMSDFPFSHLSTSWTQMHRDQNLLHEDQFRVLKKSHGKFDCRLWNAIHHWKNWTV